MRTIPRARGFDQTLAFAREGYAFIGNCCDRLGTDIFQGRLMFWPVICMRGAEAAEIFYAGDRFTRVGAMPASVLRLLQDYGSVQLLDGAAHRCRKRMFLSIGSKPEAAGLAEAFAREWHRSLDRWERSERIVLFDEVRTMLTQAVTAWAGVPLDEDEVGPRSRELSEMIEATGSIGLRNWRALWLRQRSERWARGIVADARARGTTAGTALSSIVTHRDVDGRELDVRTAAVELLNVLRAVVAVARFIIYAAKALHEHPEARQRIAAGDEAYLDGFVQEVRRLSPFFPVIGGRVLQPFEWRGYGFPRGAWVILDLYGTNRDRHSWDDPEAFRPERFRKTPGMFELVPQGAGDTAVTHRCPGEELTLELMKAAVQLMTDGMQYEVPEQDLTVDLTRIPALPRSGFVMARPRRPTGSKDMPARGAISPSPAS